MGTSKAVLARRLIKAVAPDAQVEMLGRHLQAPGVLGRLKSADLLVGCVDNDGARLILDEFALAYAIPYFDLGVGIDVEGKMGESRPLGGGWQLSCPGGHACTA